MLPNDRVFGSNNKNRVLVEVEVTLLVLERINCGQLPSDYILLVSRLDRVNFQIKVSFTSLDFMSNCEARHLLLG